MKTIFVDLIFLVALLLVARKILHTWSMLFPKGFKQWRLERRASKQVSLPKD